MALRNTINIYWCEIMKYSIYHSPLNWQTYCSEFRGWVQRLSTQHLSHYTKRSKPLDKVARCWVKVDIGVGVVHWSWCRCAHDVIAEMCNNVSNENHLLHNAYKIHWFHGSWMLSYGCPWGSPQRMFSLVHVSPVWQKPQLLIVHLSCTLLHC